MGIVNIEVDTGRVKGADRRHQQKKKEQAENLTRSNISQNSRLSSQNPLHPLAHYDRLQKNQKQQLTSSAIANKYNKEKLNNFDLTTLVNNKQQAQVHRLQQLSGERPGQTDHLGAQARLEDPDATAQGPT